MNWQSGDTEILLNPRLPSGEREKLHQLASSQKLASHVWIASSGSSASNENSVKMIALSKSALLSSAEAVNHHLQSQKSDMWAQVLPEFHVGGLGIVARAHLSGAKVVDGLRDDRWDPEFFFQVVENEKVTLASLVPTQVFDLLLLGRPAPKSLRAIVVGGGALSEDLYSQACDNGWPLLPSFGMTECCSQVATARLDSWKKRDRGLYLLPHIEATTTADSFLSLKSPALLTGYAQIQNGKSVWIEPVKNGWLKTEDHAELNGLILSPLGRAADYLKISGEGVDLQLLQEKVETGARQLFPTQSSEIALVAISDERKGHELILAHSKKISHPQAEKLLKEFNQQVAPYERISQQVQVAEIPRTDLGKIAKEKLKLVVLAELKRKLE